LHQGRDRLLRRPGRGRHHAGRPRRGQGPHGGQGLRDGRRRRGGVPSRTNVWRKEVSASERENMSTTDPTQAVTAAQAQPDGETALPPRPLELFRAAAREFAAELTVTPLPELYGATDGKAVGTKVESMFKEHLKARYDLAVGNAANGLDFPSLNLDLKVTSIK